MRAVTLLLKMAGIWGEKSIQKEFISIIQKLFLAWNILSLYREFSFVCLISVTLCATLCAVMRRAHLNLSHTQEMVAPDYNNPYELLKLNNAMLTLIMDTINICLFPGKDWILGFPEEMELQIW